MAIIALEIFELIKAIGGIYVGIFFIVAFTAVPATESFRKGIGLAVFWPLAFPLWAWRGFKELFES